MNIPVIDVPFQNCPGINMSLSSEMKAICDAEVTSLLSKGAIENIPFKSSCFVSGIFVIPKSSGGFRPIINLKSVDKFVEHVHFKMEGVSVLRGIVRKGDFLRKSTFRMLTIPIHPNHAKFLQLIWDGSLFQFTCLCFGLSSAPWSFTKILKPLVAFLRKKGIRIIVYLDDFLILNQSKEGAERDFLLTVDLVEKCGFLINKEKTLGVAAEQREFLGLFVDSLSLSLSLLPRKVQQIEKICRDRLSGRYVRLAERDRKFFRESGMGHSGDPFRPRALPMHPTSIFERVGACRRGSND